MDEDLEELTHEELLSQAKLLRQAIREHRDSQLHDLCWYHPEMWNLLPDTKDVQPKVTTREQFLNGCRVFRESLDSDFDASVQIDIGYKLT